MTEVFTLDRQIEFAESKSVTKTLHFDLQFPMYRTIAASLRRLRELEQFKVDPLFEVIERSSLGLLVCVSATLSNQQIIETAEQMYPGKYRMREGDIEPFKRDVCLHHQGRYHMALETEIPREPKL